MNELYEASGIEQSDTVPWNAWPMYVHDEMGGKLNATLRLAGVAPLMRLLELIPGLKVVVLHGGDAQDTWSRLTRKHSAMVRYRKLAVIPTWHTGNLAMASKGEQGKQELLAAYVEAAEILRE